MPAEDLIYCHNCGREGHQLDLFGQCTLPRFEAYLKFPSLVDYDHERHGSRHNNRFYRGLLGSLNYSFEDPSRMFPSLAAEEAEELSRIRYRNTSASNGGRETSERDRYSEEYRYPRQQTRRVLPTRDRSRDVTSDRGSYGLSSRSRTVHIQSLPSQRSDRKGRNNSLH